MTTIFRLSRASTNVLQINWKHLSPASSRKSRNQTPSQSHQTPPDPLLAVLRPPPQLQPAVEAKGPKNPYHHLLRLSPSKPSLAKSSSSVSQSLGNRRASLAVGPLPCRQILELLRTKNMRSRELWMKGIQGTAWSIESSGQTHGLRRRI